MDVHCVLDVFDMSQQLALGLGWRTRCSQAMQVGAAVCRGYFVARYDALAMARSAS